MFVFTLVCMCTRQCGLTSVYVKVLEVSKGPNITQIKNVHPLIHGSTVCPSFLRAAARVRVFVRRRGWREGGRWASAACKRKLQQPGDKYLHSSKHRRTVLCSPLFIERTSEGGKKLETSRKLRIFVCL